MKESEDNKQAVTFTIEREVLSKVESIADGLGLSKSAFVNMELRIALGMVDAKTGDFMRGKK